MTGLVASGVALPGRLQRTDLELRPGEITCLIGPNGSGKTSLLHALGGIGRPEGRVRFGDLDLRTVPSPQRSRLLSYLPASRDIAWPLAVRDLASLGLKGPDTAERVDQALRLMEMDGLADRRADQLSTGERSRALIARALASEPPILLLDEPTANLDPLWQLRLMDHLEGLAHREGRTLLVAIHDLDAARRHADRLLVMNSGRLAADGPPADLLGGPLMSEIFGIALGEKGWEAVRPLADPRSSP